MKMLLTLHLEIYISKFMTRKTIIYMLLPLALAFIVAGCNKESESYYESDYSNASVSSFRLKANSKILNNLDSVFFSIDLNRRLIFNADSLPVGTKIDRLQVNIGTPTVSGCEITFRPAGADKDSTVNYLANPNDSIDFSNGPVKLVITSVDGLVKQEYSVKVNVHLTEPDSLTWNNVAWRTLPSIFDEVDAQKTIDYDGTALCLTTYASSASVAVMEGSPDRWLTQPASLPAGAEVESLQAVGTTLYIIDNAGKLYSSANRGTSWTATGAVMHHLYGPYGDSVLLGARKDADGWKQVTWPASAEKAIPEGLPVAGTSQLLNYTTEWSSTPMAMMVGGTDAEGRMSGDTWAYDNGVWAPVSQTSITPASGVALVPYFAYRTNERNWKVTRRTVLLAMGGKGVNGFTRRDLFISYDRGLNWKLSDTLMVLPQYIPGFADAQALVFPTTLSSRAGSEWTECPAPRFPAWYRIDDTPLFATDSRVSKPVTEWECPYIYLFGGVGSTGVTRNTVWRGVLNRLTFRPVY